VLLCELSKYLSGSVGGPVVNNKDSFRFQSLVEEGVQRSWEMLGCVPRDYRNPVTQLSGHQCLDPKPGSINSITVYENSVPEMEAEELPKQDLLASVSF